MHHRLRARLVVSPVVAALALATAACVPTPDPRTTVEITTELTWCGGVIPPPGEPWCHTGVTSRAVEVLQGRSVVASGTSDSSGRLTLAVPAGALTVRAADPQVYEQCDDERVTAVAMESTPVTQTCTIFAP